MKRNLFVILLCLLPALLIAQVKQFQLEARSNKPMNTFVTITGNDPKYPPVEMNVIAEYNQEKEQVSLTFGKAITKPTYNCVWLPQEAISYKDLSGYFKDKGNKMKTSRMFDKQVESMGLMDKSTEPSIVCEGGVFDGLYYVSPQPKLEMDKRLIPLDGKASLKIILRVSNHGNMLLVHVKNPIPIEKNGKTDELQYVGNDFDIVLNIRRDYCDENSDMMKSINEYLVLFANGENSLKEASRPMKGKTKEMLLEQFEKIDSERFNGTGCPEIQAKYDELMACIGRINEMESKPAPGKVPAATGSGNDEPQNLCDVNKLNNDVERAIEQLNNIFNGWSLAKDAASKQAKKDEFDTKVKSVEAMLNALPKSCRNKLDAKIVRNYEFVKKLFK